MDVFIGTIMPWPCRFAPAGWMFCNGQILQVNQYQALFALLGATYGGDGRTTFALPDLRGRVPLGVGQGAGLANHNLGEPGGQENVTITAAQMPSHTHISNGIPASTQPATGEHPGPNMVPGSYSPSRGTFAAIYSPDTAADTTLKPAAPTGPAGNGQAHYNMQPFLALNYIIALQGIYPTPD